MIIKEVDFFNLNEDDIKDWNIVLENNNNCTIFQTPEWIETSLKWSKAKGRLIMAYRDNLPVGAYFFYIKPFKYIFYKSSTGIFESPYGGPVIIEGEDDETFDLMLRKLEKHFLVSSITVITPPFVNIMRFIRNNFKYVNKETMVLQLEESEEVLFDRMHQMKRRNIRKAEKNNIRIVHEDHSSLEVYHSMLISTYGRLNLNPPKPIEYYKDIFRSLESNKRIILSIAYMDDKPIASALFLIYNGSAIFWQGASYQEYMKFGANDLIHWDIIKYSRAQGLEHYNLLHFHDDKGLELESLKRFKEGFGARIEPYHLLVKKSIFWS